MLLERALQAWGHPEGRVSRRYDTEEEKVPGLSVLRIKTQSILRVPCGCTDVKLTLAFGSQCTPCIGLLSFQEVCE